MMKIHVNFQYKVQLLHYGSVSASGGASPPGPHLHDLKNTPFLHKLSHQSKVLKICPELANVIENIFAN